MRRFYCLAVLCLLAPSDVVAGQLAAGDQIRVRSTLERPEAAPLLGTAHPGAAFVRPRAARAAWIEGTFLRVSPDSLWYRPRGEGDGRPVALAEADVQRATLRDRRVSGTVLGGAVGAAAGSVIAYSIFEPQYRATSVGQAFLCALSGCNLPQSNSRTEDALGGAVVGGALGALLGFAIGRSVGRWQRIDAGPRVGAGGAVSLGLRVEL